MAEEAVMVMMEMEAMKSVQKTTHIRESGVIVNQAVATTAGEMTPPIRRPQIALMGATVRTAGVDVAARSTTAAAR